MAVLNIEKSFLTENRSVLDFLNQSGQGLYRLYRYCPWMRGMAAS